MFTGIVEEIGQVERLVRNGPATRLTISARHVLSDLHLGDSIAVNGVCLTIDAATATGFSSDVMPETLRRSTLGRLRPGSSVNLERAVAYGGRVGGHYVQGHVDGLGTVRSLASDGPAILVRIAAPDELLRYIVVKGFIAVDGASLTVVDVGADDFSLSLVQHTQRGIILPRQHAGDQVNLEVDIIGKYVERALQYLHARPPAGGITQEMLAKHGYS